MKNKEVEAVQGLSKTTHHIIAVLYFALTLFFLMVFTAHFFSYAETLFGPWFGDALAKGYTLLFGPVMAYLFPLATGYLGWRHLHEKKPTLKTMLLLLALLFAGTSLAAIHHIPEFSQDNFRPSNNFLGHVLSYLLSLGFGKAVFGPYFLVITTIIIVSIALTDFDIRAFLVSLKEGAQQVKGLSLPESHPEKSEIVVPSLEEEEEEIAPPPPSRDFNFMAPPITSYAPPEEQAPPVYDEPYPVDDEEELLYDAPGDDEDLLPATPPTLGEGIDLMEPLSGFVAEVDDEVIPVKPYVIPSPDVLPNPPKRDLVIDRQWIDRKCIELIRTLEEFRLNGCRIVCVNPGPVVTQFEIELAPGIPVRKILNMQDDLALKVGGKAIRIQAPIPGKAAVGIEIPNDTRETVYFKEILLSPAFQEGGAKLPVVIGKSISGVPIVEDIAKMPHLLIAGQTGAGKSVGINSFIASLLLSKTPEELRLILIDPKKVEMACYEGIPHLMSPVVTEPEKAVAALQWAVREMESRYRVMAKVGAKNLESFNRRFDEGQLQKYVDNESIDPIWNKRLPYVVVIVDELADLMMTAAKDVEALIQRLAQLARAVGIHLIVATQRPSVDIITGPIKANLTSRISFRTIQSQDSRTILGAIGAEKLLGMGDMLYLKNGAPTIARFHGSFISEEDVERLVAAIVEQGVELNKIHFEAVPVNGAKESDSQGNSSSGEQDEFFEQAARLILSCGIASTSMIQRRLSVGFSRAGRIMDQLCDAGIVGPPQGSKPREILMTQESLDDLFDTGDF